MLQLDSYLCTETLLDPAGTTDESKILLHVMPIVLNSQASCLNEQGEEAKGRGKNLHVLHVPHLLHLQVLHLLRRQLHLRPARLSHHACDATQHPLQPLQPYNTSV